MCATWTGRSTICLHAASFDLMSKIYEGDSWKKESADEPETAPSDESRSARQARADRDYAQRRIGLAEWRRITDALSEPPRRISIQ